MWAEKTKDHSFLFYHLYQLYQDVQSKRRFDCLYERIK